MKRHRLFPVLGFVLLFCAAVTSVCAQNGAVVFKGEGLRATFVYYNEEAGIVSVHTTDASFLCGPEDLTPVSIQQIALPHDAVLVRHGHGPIFTRVYWPATLDELHGDNWCPFIEGGPLVAEGIARYTYTDNDAIPGGSRTRSWGYTIAGPLYDLAEWCGDSGVVGFNWGFRARVDKDGEQTMMNWHGPRLSCSGD